MKKDTQRKLGWVLLLVAFLIGCLTIYWGEFVDEADNLAIGAQVADGGVLYQEIFTHHFPLPYFWVAGLVSLFGKSLLVMRLSLWLYQIFSLGLTMRLTGYHLPLGLGALFWSILRRFYEGNLFLYSSISALALFVLFALTFALLQRRQPAGKAWYGTIGIYAVIALFSDPLSVYPLLAVYLVLLGLDWRRALVAVAVPLGAGLLFGLYLLLSNSWNDFYQAVFVFNTTVYGRYLDTNPLRLRTWAELLLNAFDISNPRWYHLHPLRTLTLDDSFNHWFFSGFLYRFSILSATLILLLKRQYRLAIFLYVYVAAVLLINASDFRSQPFVLLALMSVAAWVAQLHWPGRPVSLQKGLQLGLALFTTILVAWLLVRSSLYTFENRGWFNPQNQFQGFQHEVQRLDQLACGQEQVYLAHYPGGAYYYWFTDLKPVGRYVYMWPWVADIGLDEVIADLDSEQMKAIVVIQDQAIWGYFPTREYLDSLYALMAADYVQVDAHTYLSPALVSACSP